MIINEELIAQCDREIAAANRLLRSGEVQAHEALIYLSDWIMERQLLLEEAMETKKEQSPDVDHERGGQDAPVPSTRVEMPVVVGQREEDRPLDRER